MAGFPETRTHVLSTGTKILDAITTPTRQLVAIHTGLFRKITTFLERIELSENIHVWLVDGRMVEAGLTKRNLKFVLKEGLLSSEEFPGMTVDHDQNIGTLAGLVNKLVLTNQVKGLSPSQKVIVPHSTISISPGQHQSVALDLGQYKSPKFFVYNIDRRMRFLKAGRSQAAWIYLAALHGATSSPLVDFFTGMTGTEMAFLILQQPRIWSCQPYGEDCLEILKQIAAFSPVRQFYPKHLQTQQKVKWPPGLSPLCSHEGYSLLVDKLLEESLQLEGFFVDPTTGEQSPREEETVEREGSSSLSLKHYWRNCPLQNTATHLTRQFRPGDNEPPARHVRTSLLLARKETTAQTRLLGYLCHNWLPPILTDAKIKSIRGLLVTEQVLPAGETHLVEDLKTKADPTIWTQVVKNLRESWINLYNVAVEVSGDEECMPMWTLLISFLAFHGANFDQLLLLHFIAVKGDKFRGITLANYSYQCPSAQYSDEDVSRAVRQHSLKFDGNNYPTHAKEQEARIVFEKELNQDVQNLVAHIRNQWVPRVTKSINIGIYAAKINSRNAKESVDKLIQMWYQNSVLDEFLKKLENVFHEELPSAGHFLPEFLPFASTALFSDETTSTPNYNILQVLRQTVVKPRNNIDGEAFTQTKSGQNEKVTTYEAQHFLTVKGFLSCLGATTEKSKFYWTQLEDFLQNAVFGSNALSAAGLYPRLVPVNVLPLLLEKKDIPVLAAVQELIGITCVYWTLEQKMVRCIRYLLAGPGMEVALAREKETIGIKQWNPKEKPEWLLLELELDFTIRPTQVAVSYRNNLLKLIEIKMSK